MNQKERYERYNLKKRYGITPEDKLRQWQRQNGRCGICGQWLKPQDLKIDHNHITGVRRGLLCQKCNLNLEWLLNNYINIQSYLGGKYEF
jgi:hypothetical protein